MFKDNLVSLRKIHGYSQDELAEKIGVTRQTLSKYETGITHTVMGNIPYDEIMKIAEGIR